MEGGAAAAIEVLLQNLIDVCTKDISLIRGLDKDAVQLKTTLAMIQSYLNDADKKLITEAAIKIWLGELEAVAFSADNVLDELSYHLLHKKVNKMKTIKEKVPSFFSSFNHISRPQNMAHTIKQINMDFESLHQKATMLRLESIFVNAPTAAAPDAAFETDSFTLDPIFIGRDDDVPILVDMLTKSPEVRQISILVIVGMGGMGKTTLTRKVFNHEKMKAQFGSIIWVHVSQTFDPIIILKKILTLLTSQTHDVVESREVALKKLQEALKAQTYLLVLDDVWNEDREKWENFINSLSGVSSVKGNGIIMTTRNTKVASIVNPLHIHRLNGLSNEDSWSIIKAKAFEKGSDVPSGFEPIGGKIARRCQGLPLAANVVGGVLRDKSEQDWLSIQQKWLSDVEGDNISKILRLSFDNLSSPSLKKCFAYCSIFPKGKGIVKQELIELWMAEEFLQPDRRNDMESVGVKFVNVLLQNSLLQVEERDDYGNVESCGMHDLVHDLASSVLGSFKVDDNNSNGISQIRYMSHESSPIPKEAAKCLRTLFLKGKISDTKFSDFKCLHALSLVGYQVEELPSSIRKLIHLRNLNISETSIEYLPEWIGELHHLQTLRAENGGHLRKLPSTLKYLISLRHLYILDYVKLPPEIGRLTCLQTLTHFTVGNEKGCQIEELGCLKNLKGKIQIRNLEMVDGKEEAEKANIFQNPNLLELRFQWNIGRKGEINDESVLEGLQPHPNLSKLEIWNFQGKRFPWWTLKMAVRDNPGGSWVGLNKLTEITLIWCRQCEEIPTLGHLPDLKSLYLGDLRNVKSIKSSFYRIGNNIVFPALERLTLSGMHELREWAQVESRPNCEVKVFPHLQYLKIDSCKQLMSAPSYFPSCLKQLEITRMDSSIPLGNICGVKLTSLTKLDIEGLDGLESLPDWLFHNNQGLTKLKIRKCPKLRELPDGLDALNSLEELIIQDCPNLKSIGNPSGGGELSIVCIERCQGLMELPREMVESWAPSLETLSLRELSSLNNLPMVIACLAKSARLSELNILGVPKFMAASSVESWPFRSLRKLEIDVSINESSSSVAIKETVDGILPGCNCHSLTSLHLKGMDIWECLPESIQNLTALSLLELENFGIEELPEWFGNLSSLGELRVYSCKKLRRQPSVDALGRLTKLRYLYITDCPELRIDSDEWRKINPHLSIWVDGRRWIGSGS